MKKTLKIVLITLNIVLALVMGVYATVFLTGPVDQLFGLVPLLISFVSLTVVIKLWRKSANEIPFRHFLLATLPLLLVILVTIMVLFTTVEAIRNGNK